MELGFARRILPAILAAGFAIGASSAASAAPALHIKFKNSSGLADSDVYVGFIGGAGTQFKATNIATGKNLALSQYQHEHWYKLSTLPSGISLKTFTGGRIYVGYGKPWTIMNSGYEPPPAVSTDPNYLLRYDKMEMTYTGDPADVADTTSIDYFSIPLALKVYKGGTSGKLVGSVTGSPVDTTVTALRAATSPSGGAKVNKGSDFVRMIGPGVYPPPPGLPASPYNDFQSYLSYLHKIYGPTHGKVIAKIKGHFAGVGAGGSATTSAQDYDFTASIDGKLNIELKGSGSVIGKHTLLITDAALVSPTGIYGANPMFSIDGASPISPQNDVYGWIVGDLLAGLNIGAVGSTVVPKGQTKEAGQMDSQQWFKLKDFFAALQPHDKNYYNRWAAALAPISQAYNFAYSDRFAHVVATLNPGAPSYVDTLQIVFLPKTGPAAAVTR